MSVFAVGVTGHRRLPEDKLSSITRSIRAFFSEMVIMHGNIVFLSSLAEGADTLCAKLALDFGLQLVVPLPMDVGEYRKDFSESSVMDFNDLLSRASEVFTVDLPEPMPNDPTRGFYYRQAGIYMVRHCDMLMAVWNGVEKVTPDGAGTWETVKMARAIGKEICYFTV